MSDRSMQPIAKPFHATVTPPGSKSLTNRALVMAVLASGECEMSNILLADDTAVMIDSLGKLGFTLDVDKANHSVRIAGMGGRIPTTSAELFCGNSGTTIRFLTALLTLGRGTYTLDGVARMRQRPIGQLAELLSNLGGRFEFAGDNPHCPPLKVLADTLPGGITRFGASASSQYLSALLMVAPYARIEVRVDLEPNQTSWPYVAMTMQLMDTFGVTPELHRDPLTGQPKQIHVPRGVYHPTKYSVEPDASNATYFLAAAAINPRSKVTIEGLGKRSLQGDVGFADVLHKMGADLIFGKGFITVTGTETFEGIDVDLSHMPDTAQTLAVACLFADGESTLRGLRTLRVKETDRLQALVNELGKLGAKTEVEGDDALTIHPPKVLHAADIATYDDHRMAMSFAVAGTRRNGIVIKDAECVNKTYPGFFTDFDKVIRQSII